jgi:hypothetical protein
MLDEVTEECGSWRPKRHMVDVTVQGLIQSEDELRHATKISIPRSAEYLEPPLRVSEVGHKSRAALSV